MALTVEQRAVEIAKHLANHSIHGYSQPRRAGVGTGGSVGETITLSDGTQVGISLGDRDCSSLCIEVYKAQGIDCGGAWYTGDMRSKMSGTGNFKVLNASTWSNPKAGDLLLNDGAHVAIAIGNGQLVEAAHSEYGTIDGKSGDQTGDEVRIHNLYNYPWKCVLRYCGPEPDGSSSSDSGSTTNANTGDFMTLVSGSTYRCNYDTLYVHSSPDTLASTRTGSLTTGNTITMSSTKTANGYLWGVYTANSGKTRYVAIKQVASSNTSSTSTSAPAGTYKCLDVTNIRKAPSLSGAVSGSVAAGTTRVLDGWSTVADGWVWGRYTNNNGYWRYVAVRKADGSYTLLKKVD